LVPASDHIKLELFHGEVHPAEARVYVRAFGERLDDSVLGGTVMGPFSRSAHTLPSRFALRDLGMVTASAPKRCRLAEAILQDPSYWLPQLPNCYDVDVQLRRGGDVVYDEKRLLGICPLGTRGRDLVLNGRRWVLRGSRCGLDLLADEKVWKSFRDSSTAVIVDQPHDVLCERASRDGVLLVAHVTAPLDSWQPCVDELDRLARWPAVRFAVLHEGIPAESLAWHRFGNVILAQHVPARKDMRAASWAQILLCEGTDVHDLAHRAADISLPVVALRTAKRPVWADGVRTECDRLQRDLAPYIDLAGYFT
jgi:hypothetical protein